MKEWKRVLLLSSIALAGCRPIQRVTGCTFHHIDTNLSFGFQAGASCVDPRGNATNHYVRFHPLKPNEWTWVSQRAPQQLSDPCEYFFPHEREENPELFCR